MKSLVLIFFGLLFFDAPAQNFDKRLFESESFTLDSIFTTNIEGPAFDNRGSLYVVNFTSDGTIGKVNKNGEVTLFVTLPQGRVANSIQFDSKGTMLLADFTRHSILSVNMKTKKISILAHHKAFNQPNDLCINHRDQLFASDPDWKSGTGKLWRIDPDGTVVLLQDNMGTTNGIELSPDEKTLYVNESVQRTVWAFDVDVGGTISNKRLLISFEDHGLDGMKCDKKGNLYIARYGKGTIAVVSPSGILLHEVMLQGKKCSNLVFGGKGRKTVFVTLQDRKGMEKFRNDIPGKK